MKHVSLIKNFKYLRDPEARWRDGGWGPKLTFLATRSDDEPLVLTLRIPLEWETCDVLNMPAEVAVTPGSVLQAMATVGKLVDRAGAITVLGIARPVKREGKPDVLLFATITIALSDLAGPPPEWVPGAEVEPMEFRCASGVYRGTRISQTQSRDLLRGQPPVSFLTQQYMRETEHGRLVVTFATPQGEIFTKLTSLFVNIANGVELARPALEPSGRRPRSRHGRQPAA